MASVLGRSFLIRLRWDKFKVGIAASVAAVFGVVLLGLLVELLLTGLMARRLSIWESHLITVIAGSGAAALCAYVVLRKWERLGRKLAREIAERIRYETALGKSRASFANIVERTADGIIVVDKAGTVRFANPAVWHFLTGDVADLTGKELPFPLPAETVAEIDFSFQDGRPGVAEVQAVQTQWEGRSANLVTLRDITQRKRAEEVLRNLVEGVSSATGESFFKLLAKKLADVLALDYVLVGALEASDPAKVRTLACFVDGTDAGEIEYHLEGTPCETVIGKGFCYYPSSVQSLFPEDTMLADMDVQSYIGNPLFDGAGNPIGLIVVMNRGPIRDPESAESLITVFGARAASELERLHAERGLKRSEADLFARNESLEAINSLSDALYRSLDLQTVAERAVEAMFRYRRSPVVNIFVVNERDCCLRLLHAKGLDEETVDRGKCLPLDGSLSGLAVSTGDIVVSTNIHADGRIESNVRESLTACGYESGIAIPLLFQEKVLGVLGLIFKTPLEVSNHELVTLRAIGKSIGLAMANAQHVEQLRAEVAERTKAEEAAHESAARYRAIVEGFDGFIYIRTRDRKIEFVNDKLRQHIGRPVVGEHCHRALYDLDEPCPWCPAASVENGETVQIENKSPKDGRWYYSVHTPIFHSDGDFSVQTMILDITQRKLDEERLLLLKEAVEALPIGITISDMKSHIVYVNPAEALTHGYEEDELLGHPARMLAPRQTWGELSFEHLHNMGFWRRESVNIRKDGTEFPVQLTSIAVKNLKGEPVGIVTACEDITSRTQAEKALRDSEERYRLLFERNLAGVFRSTLDGRILECNEALARIYGYTSRDELIGQSVERVHKNIKNRAEFVKALKETGTVVGRQGEGRKKDGSPVWIIANASLLKNEQGEPAFIEGTVIDITERLKAEEQLRQAQKMEAVGRLAGGVAHDFNNLLQAALNIAELLLADPAMSAESRGDLEDLESCIQRGAQLSRQLLLFSRRETTNPRRLDLNQLITSLTKLLTRVLKENIELKIDLYKDPLWVRTDRVQMEQVLMNLAVNASDAMPEGGFLRVGTCPATDSHVLLEVEDSGHGIPDEAKPHIFEPFFTTKEGSRGTGLGLAVVHGIVSRHGGTVSVMDRAGGGTRFEIVLPRSEAPGQSAESEARKDRIPSRLKRGIRVLLVEDEEMVRANMGKALAEMGYTVTQASGRAEVDEQRKKGPFDVLISDVVLTDCLGMDLWKELRNEWPLMRVIFMSGYVPDQTSQDGLLADGCRWIQKPFGLDALEREIQAVLLDKTSCGPGSSGEEAES